MDTRHRLPRSRRLRPLLLALGLLFSTSALADDEDGGGDRGDDKGDDIDTETTTDPATEAADAVGDEIGDRLDTMDCTGLGPEGCLGLVLLKVMCIVDGRDIVKIACGEMEAMSGDQGGTSDTRILALRDKQVSSAAVRTLSNYARGDEIVTLQGSDGPVVRFVVERKFDAATRHAVISAVDVSGGKKRPILVGHSPKWGLYAMDGVWYQQLHSSR